MATDTIEPLRSLAAHARQARDRALARLGQAQLAQRAAQAQAEQLATYQTEYKQRWSDRFRQATTTLLLQCYQGFADRLEQAIVHQTHTMHQAGQRQQQAQLALLQLERRVAAVDKLIERRQVEQNRIGRRLDQRESDEFAARRASDRRPVESLL